MEISFVRPSGDLPPPPHLECTWIQHCSRRRSPGSDADDPPAPLKQIKSIDVKKSIKNRLTCSRKTALLQRRRARSALELAEKVGPYVVGGQEVPAQRRNVGDFRSRPPGPRSRTRPLGRRLREPMAAVVLVRLVGQQHGIVSDGGARGHLQNVHVMIRTLGRPGRAQCRGGIPRGKNGARGGRYLRIAGYTVYRVCGRAAGKTKCEDARSTVRD